MELKLSVLVVLFMAQSYSVMGAFVDPHAPMNNTKWKEQESKRLEHYAALQKSEIPVAEGSDFNILLNMLFYAGGEYLSENAQELIAHNICPQALSKATRYATRLVACDEIKKVHGLESWTLMHLAAYTLAKKCEEDVQRRQNSLLPKNYYIAADDFRHIIFCVKNLKIPLGVETDHLVALNHRTSFGIGNVQLRDTVLPLNVVDRFTPEEGLLRKKGVAKDFFEFYEDLNMLPSRLAKDMATEALTEKYKDNFLGIAGLSFDPALKYK